MGQLIIEGAGYFLNSHADMLKFLNRVEMSQLSGPDYPELQDILDSAIKNMENAAETYKILISTAKETPYNPGVIAKLATFDYQGYRQKNEMNVEIFSRITAYLIKGDVTGVYILLKSDMDHIIKKLHNVKRKIDGNIFPDISTLWRVNDKYSESLLSGQYISEVFMAL